MSVARIESLVERLARSANVESVFGDPIERGDRTVIPVARVSYGFGGGYGRAGVGDTGQGNAAHGSAAQDALGQGGGGGGGASATPVGALEIHDGGAEFVRFRSRKRSAALALAGVAVGFAVGRWWDRD